jgi:NitT/TauT family transport system substrate-binding protein
MRTGFAQEHPELAEKMVLAHTQALEYIYLHPAKSAEFFAANYNVPVEVGFMTIYTKTVKEGRTLTWRGDDLVKRINYNMEYNKSLGLADYQTYVPAEQWVDLALLKKCGADDFDTFIKTKVDPVFPLTISYADWKIKALQIDAK